MCCQSNVGKMSYKLSSSSSLAPCRSSMQVFGIAFALKKLKKEDIQPIIDKMVDMLSGWKADLINRAGRKIHV
jgi:hypothetical protein